MLRRKRTIWIILLTLLASCLKVNQHDVDFYYWKTDVEISEIEKNYFENLNSQKLYIRFFDIDDEGNGALPKAKVKLFDSKLLRAQYVPVVFIMNRVFKYSYLNINDLATKTFELITQIETKNQLLPGNEIQIDCDWTESTKRTFFDFLQVLKEISGREITCTLRLHQVKFSEKAGIPPVKKGYLMCYATSEIGKETGRNSILDMELLKDYTQNIDKYPLCFDVALPLYSWGVVTNHLGNNKLINGLLSSDLIEPDFVKTGENEFEAQRDLFFKGMYISKGFTIVVEEISPQLLQQAKDYLNRKIKKDYNIVYYHLDKTFLTRFAVDELK